MLGARDRDDVAAGRLDEGQGDLSGRAALGLRQLVDDFDDGDVGRQVVPLEPGVVATEVRLVELVERTELAGEEPASERAVRDEADAELAQRREDLLFRVARPDRVLGLEGRNGMHCVGAADGGGRRLGEPEIADLALRHQLAHRADRLLDRRIGVDPVLVVEVYVIDAEPGERSLAGLADVLGPPVDAALGRVVGVAHDAELGGDDGSVAPTGQRLAHQYLVRVGPVHVRGVEEGHTELEGAVDRGDRLLVVAFPVEVRHAHAPQPLARHHEALVPERNRFHGAPLRRAGRPR